MTIKSGDIPAWVEDGRRTLLAFLGLMSVVRSPDRLNRMRLFVASRRLVTPFTGFILSDFHLSSEIAKNQLQWLNRRSQPLSRRNLSRARHGDVFFVQVDELEDFVSNILPSVSTAFVLISGKHLLPGWQPSATVEQILENHLLIAWFSQNAWSPGSPVKFFPYGVELSNAPLLLRRSRRCEPLDRRIVGPLIPFFTIHKHLSGEALEDRTRIAPMMAPFVKFEQYLETICQHVLVFALQGDRPDTYRLWEVLATGGIPVVNLPRHWSSVFGNSVIWEDELEAFADETEIRRVVRQGVKLTRVKFWERIIRDVAANPPRL